MIDTIPEYLFDDDLSDPQLADLFAALHAQGSGAPPIMSADLAAALGAARPSYALAPRRDRRTAHRAGVAALLATGLVSVGVGAAAAGVLPGPAQRVVSDVIARLTPIELPRPHTGTPRRSEPTPGPGKVLPVAPEGSAQSEPTDRDDDSQPTGTSPTLGGSTQDADDATDEAQNEGERESVASPEEGDTSGTGSGTARGDSSERDGDDASQDPDEGSDASEGGADGMDGGSPEGQPSSGSGAESDSEDSGPDGQAEE